MTGGLPSGMALVLLAAGRSERFGGNKLMADCGGIPLGLRAATRFAAAGFGKLIAVVSGIAPDYGTLGYRVIVNQRPELGLSSSLVLGLEAAGPGPVMIGLADMPNVSLRHIRELLARFDSEAGLQVVASSDRGVPMPPAIFPGSRCPELARLEGDKGARAMLAQAMQVPASPEELLDVDLPGDLDRVVVTPDALTS